MSQPFPRATDPEPIITVITLQAGDLRLALRPDIGGSIAGLWLGDLPVLRSSDPETLAGPRASGCFPMLPYSNRLGYRRFKWLGAEHTTRPNFDDSPHSLHGVGWHRAWQVASARADDAVVTLSHPGDADWPFAFDATQTFALTPGAMNVGLKIVNRAPHPAPVGLGWHPYFPKRARSRMHIELTHRWASDTTGLPTRREAHAGLDADVAHLEVDHCFEGWPGHARLRDEKLSLRLASSLQRLVVYTPPLKPYYCVEPVSHVSNAIHMADPAAHGLMTLEPGAHTEAWMKLEIAPV